MLPQRKHVPRAVTTTLKQHSTLPDMTWDKSYFEALGYATEFTVGSPCLTCYIFAVLQYGNLEYESPPGLSGLPRGHPPASKGHGRRHHMKFGR